MSAAQPTLAGLDLPDVEPANNAHVKLVLGGLLASNAQSWTTEAGEVRLEVCIQQHVHGHPHAVPIVACMRIEHPSQVMAIDTGRRKAAELLRGARVVVVGLDLQPGMWHGKPALKILHTLHIGLDDEAEGTAFDPPAHLNQQPAAAGREASHHAH